VLGSYDPEMPRKQLNRQCKDTCKGKGIQLESDSYDEDGLVVQTRRMSRRLDGLEPD